MNFVPWYIAMYGVALAAMVGGALGPVLCAATAAGSLVLMVTFGVMEWNEQREWT